MGILNKLIYKIYHYPNQSYHDFDTHTYDDIHIYRIKHEFGKRRIRCDTPLIVNNTSNLIKNKIVTHGLHGFSCYIKKHFFYKITITSVQYQTAIYIKKIH